MYEDERNEMTNNLGGQTPEPNSYRTEENQPENSQNGQTSQNGQSSQNSYVPEQGYQRAAEPEQSKVVFQSAAAQAASQNGEAQAADAQSATSQYSTANRGGWEQAPRNNSYIPQERQRSSRKKHSVAAKVAGVTAAALLFGTVAGGTMFAVNTAGEYLRGQYMPQIGQTETAGVTIGQSETQGDGSSTAGAPVTSALQTDVSTIVEKAMPSVVAINNTMLMQQQTWFGPSQTVEVPSSGSGIIVGQNDEELLIVTNNHVVQDSKELTVTFINDAQVAASIKGTDSESDLAVIAIKLSDIPSDTMSQIKVATLGDSDQLKVGQGVVAIGNALGYGQSVTVGYVSALNREVKEEDSTSRNLLQTDAAINPGNSGGALLNMRGEVIGINAAKYSSTAVEGMGYAIPISQAQDIINELMNKKTRTLVDEKDQGYLGIQGQNIDETAAAMYGMPRGIYVYKIVENSAAAQSDLKEKDIITKFDGQTVRTMADLKDMLTYYQGGDTIDLTVQSLSDGQYTERTVSITLGTKPAGETN